MAWCMFQLKIIPDQKYMSNWYIKKWRAEWKNMILVLLAIFFYGWANFTMLPRTRKHTKNLGLWTKNVYIYIVVITVIFNTGFSVFVFTVNIFWFCQFKFVYMGLVIFSLLQNVSLVLALFTLYYMWKIENIVCNMSDARKTANHTCCHRFR